MRLVPSCSHHRNSAFVGITTSYAIPGKENGQQLWRGRTSTKESVKIYAVVQRFFSFSKVSKT